MIVLPGLVAALALRAAPAVEPGGACADPGRRRVALATAALERVSIEAEALAAHLRAELAAQAIALCPPEAGAAPLASVEISAALEGDAVLIRVVDRLTAKRLERELDLVSIPRRARALVGALAAVHLLQASWAELSEEARSAPPLRAPLPPPRPAPEVPRAAPGPTWDVGAGVASAAFGGGLRSAGPELQIGLAWGSRWRVAARLAHHWGARVDAPDGVIATRGLWSGLAVGRRFGSPAGGVAVVVGPALELAALRASGRPRPGATGSTASSVSVQAAAAGVLVVPVAHRWDLTGSLSAGWTVRPVHLRDELARVAAASGWTAGGGLGLRVALP